MQKQKKQKLALQSQTVRILTEDNLARVVGGTLQYTGGCFIMKDTIIIKTSG